MKGIVIVFKNFTKPELIYFNARFGCLFKLARKKKSQIYFISFDSIDSLLNIIEIFDDKEKLRKTLNELVFDGNAMSVLVLHHYGNKYKVEYKNLCINFLFVGEFTELEVYETVMTGGSILPTFHRDFKCNIFSYSEIFDKIRIKSESDLFKLTFKEFKKVYSALLDEYSRKL